MGSILRASEPASKEGKSTRYPLLRVLFVVNSNAPNEVSMMQFEDKVPQKMRRAATKRRSDEEATQYKSKQPEQGLVTGTSTARKTQNKSVTKTTTKKAQNKSATKAATKKAQNKSATRAATKNAQQRAEETKMAEERPGLLPRQAWSNCCGSIVAEGELDSNGNCKDQSDASECKKRKQRRGKRRCVVPRR